MMLFTDMLPLLSKLCDIKAKIFYPVHQEMGYKKEVKQLMNEYTYCEYCKVFIPYVKDKDRYVSCPNCHQDLYVGTEKLYKKGKFKRSVA